MHGKHTRSILSRNAARVLCPARPFPVTGEVIGGAEPRSLEHDGQCLPPRLEPPW